MYEHHNAIYHLSLPASTLPLPIISKLNYIKAELGSMLTRRDGSSRQASIKIWMYEHHNAIYHLSLPASTLPLPIISKLNYIKAELGSMLRAVRIIELYILHHKFQTLKKN
jgi:hypothetical protein